MSQNKRVYICDVDYLYTEKAPEFENLVGGAVYVFIKAFDVREALAILEKDMQGKNIEAKEIVAVNPYDANQEWESEEERNHYLQLYMACEKTDDIVYDDFLAYERE